MNIQQYISNDKCRTILHKILISRVTIGFTEFIQDISRRGSVHDSPWPGIQFGDLTKLSPVGFPLQAYTFAPTSFNSRNFSSQCFRSDEYSLKNLPRLRLVRWPHLLSLTLRISMHLVALFWNCFTAHALPFHYASSIGMSTTKIPHLCFANFSSNLKTVNLIAANNTNTAWLQLVWFYKSVSVEKLRIASIHGVWTNVRHFHVGRWCVRLFGATLGFAVVVVWGLFLNATTF